MIDGLDVGEIGQQHREHVAAEARQHAVADRALAPPDVQGAVQAALEPAGDLLEQRVPRGVPQGVVDPLEAIQVQEDHRSLGLQPSGPLQGVLHGLYEARAVYQPGHAVVVG